MPRQQKERLTPAASGDHFFIPDLCKVNAVLFLLILTQLLSLVLSFTLSEKVLLDWELLGLFSLFCHAIALSFASIMCLSRAFLRHKSLLFVSLYFISINALITLGIASLGSLTLFAFILENPQLFILKSCIISSIIASILLRYFYLQAQWQQQKQAELHARIQALQARIRPHFLFNSMNSIASLISINPEKAEDAVLDLCSLFRATLNNQQTLIPLDEELSLCRRYLNIEALRLGKRLKLDWQDKDLNDYPSIPPLTLQPLFENAIYHGIQPRTEGGTITLKLEKQPDALFILISNPYSRHHAKHEGNHIALENIRSRLQAILGEQAILKTSIYNDIFTVTVRLPLTSTRKGRSTPR
jgi:two-component system sensor histidine kinase AlgZ